MENFSEVKLTVAKFATFLLIYKYELSVLAATTKYSIGAVNVQKLQDDFRKSRRFDVDDYLLIHFKEML